VRAADHVVHTVDDGWLMPIEKPGRSGEICGHLVDELLLGLARGQVS